MNKRRLHHSWKSFRKLRPWYFLILAVISAVICVFALRANNQQMVKYRDAVYTADQNNGDVQTALSQLQTYVIAHMNTNLSSGSNAIYPPIQLKYTYDRLSQAQAAAIASTNSQIYTEAQNYCEQQNSTDFSGHNRVPCIEQYVQSHSAIKLAPIPEALYKFDFFSPVWTPDFAGWTMVLAIVFGLLFIVTFVVDRWFIKHVA